MYRAELFAALACAVLALGCDTGEVTGPDARVDDGDGGVNPGDPDARPGDVSAIELEFRTDPEVPTDSLGSPWAATITRVAFDLDDLRIVGDAATLNKADIDLEFTEREHIKQLFAPAAPGMYATFIGHIDRYEIEGTVDVGGSTEDFRISDTPSASTTFVVQLGNVDVAAGQTKSLRIDIELSDFVNGIDWDNAENEDGTLEPANEESLRDEIAASFTLH